MFDCNFSSSSCRWESPTELLFSLLTTSLDNLSGCFRRTRAASDSRSLPRCRARQMLVAESCTSAHFPPLTVSLMGETFLAVWSEGTAQNTLLTGGKQTPGRRTPRLSWPCDGVAAGWCCRSCSPPLGHRQLDCSDTYPEGDGVRLNCSADKVWLSLQTPTPPWTEEKDVIIY